MAGMAFRQAMIGALAAAIGACASQGSGGGPSGGSSSGQGGSSGTSGSGSGASSGGSGGAGSSGGGSGGAGSSGGGSGGTSSSSGGGSGSGGSSAGSSGGGSSGAGSSGSGSSGSTGSSGGTGSSSGSSGGGGSTSSGSNGGGSDAGAGVPEFGKTLTVVGTAKDGLNAPRDLKFDPFHPEQLWTANEGINGIVLYQNPGTAQQTSEVRVDYYARHFMDKVSSISFGANNEFASCQESHDDWNDQPQAPDDFMGPTLWLADLDIFAKVNQTFPPPPEGSHIDMNHESPLCTGIAWDHDLVYWAYDGQNRDIVRYDFVVDHGPGGQDHSHSIVRRYVDATVTPVAEVASHMIVDHATGILYVADTGASRVMKLDTATGSVTGSLPQVFEPLAEYSKVQGASYTALVTDVAEPSGIELNAGRLFVSDHKTGTIRAYALDGTLLGTMSTGATGLMGITIGPDHKLWFVDREAQTVARVDP
jgi:hypothetical protein